MLLLLCMMLFLGAGVAWADDLPRSYNANPDTRLQHTTPVRLQNPWDTCWAFAAVSAMESDLLASGLSKESSHGFLSPRHLAYFGYLAHGEGAQAEEGSYPVDGWNVYNLGGSSQIAVALLSSGRGPAWESAYPYQGAQGTIEYASDAEAGSGGANVPVSYSADDDWTIDPSQAEDTAGFQLRAAYVVGSTAVFADPEDRAGSYSLDEDLVHATKQLVLEHGAATVDYWRSGLDPEEGMDVWNPDYAVANHAVVIVGWDDDYSKEHFANGGMLPEGDGAWVCKNSLGSYYRDFPDHSFQEGFDGYFHLSYYDRSIDGITAFDLVADDDADYGTEYVDQYDYLGRSSNMDNLSNLFYGDAAYGNVFTAQQDQTVTHVSLELYHSGCKTNIRVYKLFENAASPIDGELVCEQDVIQDLPGFYKVKLVTPLALKAGERYSVVERVSDEYNTCFVQMEATGVGEGVSYVQNLVMNEGESWLRLDGSWVDAVKGKAPFEEATNRDSLSDCTWTLGNVMVKGYARAYDANYAVEPGAIEAGTAHEKTASLQQARDGIAARGVVLACMAALLAASCVVAALLVARRRRERRAKGTYV